MRMEIEWHIGDVVRKLRERRHLSQSQLAKKVGVNKVTIWRVEDADSKVKRETWLKIAEALNTTMAELELEAARLSRREEIWRPAREVAGTAGESFHGGLRVAEDGAAFEVSPPAGIPERRTVPDRRRRQQ